MHLLCLWCLTAGTTLAHLRCSGLARGACPAGAPPIHAAILAQLLCGFLLASLLAYLREARTRRRFLHTSHRAAAYLRRQALPASQPAPAAPVRA